jgi:hypothetical protein
MRKLSKNKNTHVGGMPSGMDMDLEGLGAGKITESNPVYRTPRIRENYARNAIALFGGVLFSLYTIGGIFTKAWTPKQMREYNERSKIEADMKEEHIGNVNYEYERIFDNAKTFQDSVEIYQKFGLPIILSKPSFKQKEEAVKQNELEKSVK